MSLFIPQTLLFESQFSYEPVDESPSILSSATNQKTSRSPSLIQSIFFNRALRLQAGDISIDLSDDENDFDDNASARENYRFTPKLIRTRHSRHNSFRISTTNENYFRPSRRKSDLLVIQAPPPGSLTLQNAGYTSMLDHQPALITANMLKEIRGQTLLHLAGRLGHDEILRLLISETSQGSMLMNKKGQTPLLTAIEAGSTSSATLLMESDPRSIVACDINGSSVFHYACEHCNDVVLNRAIVLSKRLNSTSDRITVKIDFSEKMSYVLL